jgi:hypothetical protein
VESQCILAGCFFAQKQTVTFACHDKLLADSVKVVLQKSAICMYEFIPKPIRLRFFSLLAEEAEYTRI